MIVAQHAQGHFGISTWVAGFFSLVCGVSIFFVLSGFILVYRYPDLPTWNSVWRFWIKRFARLWPAHIATTLGVLWLTWVGRNHDGWMAAQVALNAAMIQTWIPTGWFSYSFNMPSWSIATEFGFYALFPLLIRDFYRNWWWKWPATFMIVVLLAAICSLFGLRHPGPADADQINISSLLYLWPVGRLFEFVTGMVAALAWLTFAERLRLQLSTMTATVLELAALGLLIFSMANLFWADGNIPIVYWWHTGAKAALPAALLIFVLALGQGLLSRALSFWPLVIGGEISYAMYLVHYPMLMIYWGYQAELKASYPLWAIAIGFYALLIGISLLIWLLIEKPMRAVLSGQIFRRRVARTLQTSSAGSVSEGRRLHQSMMPSPAGSQSFAAVRRD